jgi:hypothetical protein
MNDETNFAGRLRALEERIAALEKAIVSHQTYEADHKVSNHPVADLVGIRLLFSPKKAKPPVTQAEDGTNE